MKVEFTYGQKSIRLEVAEHNLLAVRRGAEAPPLSNLAAAVQLALEEPHDYPPLRRALTPDDRVAIVVDESIAGVSSFLTPIFEHLQTGGVGPASVTLVCPSATEQTWLDDIPEEFEEVHVEIHDPANRKRLAYLATTKNGRRVYLNRTVVDADQVVVLTRRSYNPVLGYSGGETDLFPTLGDVESRRSLLGALSLLPPEKLATSLRREAAEVTWLLGAPFFVQVIENTAGQPAHVLGGVQEGNIAGELLLDAGHRIEVERAADMVIASLTSGAHEFIEFARALANCARIVKRGGRIVLLADKKPELGRAAEILSLASGSREAADLFAQADAPEREAGFFWASAAEWGRIFLLSELPAETAEDLWTAPLTHAGEVQRLLSGERTIALLPNAERVMAVVHSRRPVAVNDL